MNKLKRSILIFAVLYVNAALAQTIEQGKQLIGYEKFKSARTLFENLVAANPNNDEAVYWLGQSIILPDDISAKDLEEAKKIYQKTLDATNSQLLMAGVGHIELLQGKMQEARSHFEAAANLSQNKSIAVLNAIGFANSNPDTKNGDAVYAIDKLKMATLIKKFNDPDVLVN
jgi:tetratricopeptide (TPR) repeat protein